VPTTPADRAGALVDYFPARAAFPKWQEGRHPHCHFRGLLRLHSRYGPPDRSAAQGDLCHEAPALPVARPSRSSATGSIDNYPGGILLHWWFAPSGRTANNRPQCPRDSTFEGNNLIEQESGAARWDQRCSVNQEL